MSRWLVIWGALFILAFPPAVTAGNFHNSGREATGRPAEANPPPGELPTPNERPKIVIDLRPQTLTLYFGAKLYKTYPVAIGRYYTPSPVGEWRIIEKKRNWGSGFGSRWMGLNVPWGIYGIHGTNKPWSVGQAISGGCFRMHNRDVEEVYSLVPLGTVVQVVGELTNFPDFYSPRNIRPGDVGPDVVAVQFRLKSLGLFWGMAEGTHNEFSQAAVRYFQSMVGLPDTGTVDKATWHALGLEPLLN